MDAAELITHSRPGTGVRVGDVVDVLTLLDRTSTSARWAA
jgi:hypothetical protein